MIIEHAILRVRPGAGDAFRSAFAEARPIIAAAAGFSGVSLARGIEDPDTYLLRVHWESLTDHTEGFRGSPDYDRWRVLLHHFYEPMPTVEHYQPLIGEP